MKVVLRSGNPLPEKWTFHVNSTRFLTALPFVANFLLFQKHWGYIWWFCMCEALQSLLASIVSWLI